MTPSLDILREAGRISDLDYHLARLVLRLGGEGLDEDERADLAAAAALCSEQTRAGHVCLPLVRFAGTPVLEAVAEGDADDGMELIEPSPLEGACWPRLGAWRAALEKSRAVGVGEPPTPLVLDGAGRLYLHRYWEHETKLGAALGDRLRAPDEPFDPAWLLGALDRLFPPEPGDPPGGIGPDWRKLAALIVLQRRFAIVSGGPGTGKTTAVIKLLSLLIERAQAEGQTLRIAMMAPTGKAAARLQEVVAREKARLPVSERVRDELPVEATTIHRRLGAYGRGYVHGPGNPIPYEVVVVDESSMVDVVLMSRLVGALLPQARLLLLGDRDQLASVQAGAVLGDLCRQAADRGYSAALAQQFSDLTGHALPTDEVRAAPTDIGDAVVHLRRNFRFDAKGGIGAVAAHAVGGDDQGVLAALRDPAWPSVALIEPPEAGRTARMVARAAAWAFAPYLQAVDLDQAFRHFHSFRILCAHRRGADGVEALNRAIWRALVRAGLLSGEGEWVRGRPVMVTQNDHAQRLYNGDVGLCWPDSAGVLQVHFPDGQGGYRALLPTRLPEHETVFAMTVHKSQGSEFDRVLLVLPEKVSRALTRELVYTGVTRARTEVVVLGGEEVVRAAVRARVERWSGLGE